MNKTMQMGRLVRDPETRYVGEKAVVSFTIAVDRKFKKDGGKQADFLKCEAWGKTAETIAKFFCKGKPIIVEGRLEQQEWTDKEGNKKDKTVIVVESFDFVLSDGTANNGGGRSSTSSRDALDDALDDELAPLDVSLDDMPF